MAKSFDLQVDHYNSQGKVVRHTPYRLAIDGDKRMFERPPYSGMWYADDGSLLKDESAPIKAKQAEAEAQAKIEAEAQAKADRDKIKAEILAEIEAEKKASQNGRHTAKA